MSTSPAVTVAVVEDDPAMRQAIRRVLQTEGFAAEVFGSAEELLASDVMTRAGCLVLDVRLPGMSGVDLHRRLHSAGSRAPTIFITAEDEVRAQRLPLAETSSILTKPFLGEALVEAIGRFLPR